MKRTDTNIFVLLLLLPFLVACQTLSPRLVCALPDELKESSGLIVESANAFWTINDSGDSAKLYQFDSTGRVRKVLILRGATNVDWEELATDRQGNFYIGDFGNNGETRRDLGIYKIAKDSLATIRTDTATVSVTFTPFRYADQTAFPPAAKNLIFDAEAFLAYEDSIVVFTKDFESSPYLGMSKIYGFENRVTRAEQAARLLDTIRTDDSWKYNGAITAAAITPDGKKVALMSYQKLWIYTDFAEKAFWRGRKQTFTFGLTNFAQREAAAFLDSCTLYMTSEISTASGITIGGNLTTLNICRLLTKTKDTKTAQIPEVKLAPNPSSAGVSVQLTEGFGENLSVTIVDISGKQIAQKQISAGEMQLELSNEMFPSAGFYVAQLSTAQNRPLSRHKVFIVK